MRVAAEPLRIGVVGVGALALRGIVPHLTQPDVADRVAVTALCDPALERARVAAERYGIAGVFASVEELLAADIVDAVTIASPIGLHYAHCRLALEAGRHVHVNKTMATTVEEADELIGLAREGGLGLVPSPGEVLRPQIGRTRELIREGAIGDVAWRIINMLSLNHLGLVERAGGESAGALREMLALFADISDSATERKIRGVRSVDARPIVRRIRRSHGVGAARGVEITVLIDDKSYEGSGPFLIGAILDHTARIVPNPNRARRPSWPAWPNRSPAFSTDT